MIKVSPGKTWLVKRALNDFISSGFSLKNSYYIALAVKPKVQRPCKIGFSKPPTAAIEGSICNGFLSEHRRYRIP
jgi:hypothetical protein